MNNNKACNDNTKLHSFFIVIISLIIYYVGGAVLNLFSMAFFFRLFTYLNIHISGYQNWAIITFNNLVIATLVCFFSYFMSKSKKHEIIINILYFVLILIVFRIVASVLLKHNTIYHHSIHNKFNTYYWIIFSLYSFALGLFLQHKRGTGLGNGQERGQAANIDKNLVE